MNTYSHVELEVLSSKPSVIIGLKEKNDTCMARFEFSSNAFKHLLEAFENRIREISNQNSGWTPKTVASVHADRPSLPCDREFLSQYILVGNIDPNAFKTQESVALLRYKLLYCASYGGISGADQDDLDHLKSGVVGHIRPSGLGLDDNLCVRSMKVVKLRTPARVGITLGGGLRIV